MHQYHFPPSIEPIIDTLVHRQEFSTHVGKKKNKVYFVFVAESAVPLHIVRAAVDVVQYLWPYRKCREHSFTAEFFFCNVPKILPGKGEVLGENHVNTGYSIPCESLVVFRKQEWFKVFIHECFHYLGLDKTVAENVVLDMFTIPIEVSVRETYCEVWARLLQSNFLGGLSKERAHSVSNMVRVLRHNGLVYSDLWGTKARNYAEETNVFAYVILAAILLHDHTSFVQSFPRFVGDLNTLLQLIRKNYKSPSFLRRVAKAESERSDDGPFRMSAVELYF